MSEIINIREFQPIVREGCPHPNGRKMLPGSTFDALENFILANNPNDADDNTLEVMQITSRSGLGKVITARNYVGLVSFDDGTTLQIWPKLFASDDSDEHVAQAQAVFLEMLVAAFDIPVKQLGSAAQSASCVELLDPFVCMFAQSAIDLAQRGLKSAYIVCEGNEKALRGRLDFAQNVRINHSHKERFYVRFDEFDVGRPENRLIRSTLDLLKRRIRSASAQQVLRQALTLYVDVPSSTDVQRDFHLCKLDRTMGPYVPLLRWCRVFLAGESFTSFRGEHIAYSLLFPMERLFEAYVAKKIAQAAIGNWRVVVQDKSTWLYDGPRRFPLRPDIVLYPRRGEGRPVILDTKWKLLKTDGSRNYGISNTDMYQMYVYQRRLDARQAILVYPALGTLTDAVGTFSANSANGAVEAMTKVFALNLAPGKGDSLERLVEFIG